VILAVLIAASYSLRPAPGAGGSGAHGVARLGNMLLGIVASISFILGALCSAAAGYMSMWVAAHTNIRVTSAARWVNRRLSLIGMECVCRSTMADDGRWLPS